MRSWIAHEVRWGSTATGLVILLGVNFSVLGPSELSEGGEPLSLRRGLPRALVIYLLLHRRVPVSAEVLADRLWSGTPPLDGANAVQRVVSYVRRSMGRRGYELLVTGRLATLWRPRTTL